MLWPLSLVWPFSAEPLAAAHETLCAVRTWGLQAMLSCPRSLAVAEITAAFSGGGCGRFTAQRTAVSSRSPHLVQCLIFEASTFEASISRLFVEFKEEEAVNSALSLKHPGGVLAFMCDSTVLALAGEQQLVTVLPWGSWRAGVLWQGVP